MPCRQLRSGEVAGRALGLELLKIAPGREHDQIGEDCEPDVRQRVGKALRDERKNEPEHRDRLVQRAADCHSPEKAHVPLAVRGLDILGGNAAVLPVCAALDKAEEDGGSEQVHRSKNGEDAKKGVPLRGGLNRGGVAAHGGCCEKHQ